VFNLLKFIESEFNDTFTPKKLWIIFAVIITLSFQVAAFEIDSSIIKQVKERFGEKASSRLRYWQKVVNDAKDKTSDEQLEIANSFFNQVRFTSDQEHWQKEDYQATPLEMLVTKGADCEDYYIAKYCTHKKVRNY